MIVRQGLFEGRIKPGREDEFYAFVRERLLPVWRSFPGAVSVEVLTGEDVDDKRRFPLHTVFRFPDRAAMDAALASPARQQAVALVPQLMDLFEGRLHHLVSERIEPLA